MRMSHSFDWFTAFLFKGHRRTIKAKKNILISVIVKGLNIIIGLILVPLTIHYLSPTRYGVWVTLSSIIAWFGFFDIGLGHGLRNRFAEALANEKYNLAKTYVSTTYALLVLIIGSVLGIFYIINPFLDWAKILNINNDPELQAELSLLALIVFTLFCFRFVFKLITTILQADQRPAMASVYNLGGNCLVLFCVFLLTKTTESSLLYLGILMSGIPVLVLLLASFWFYSGRYKYCRPSLRYVDFGTTNKVLDLGLKFFVIQITVVLLYQTNNLIISHLFGPSEVTSYNVAFQYFSTLTMGFSIIIAPFWSAFTEAWTKNELLWIRRIVQKLIYVWCVFILIGIFMVLCSSFVYRIWVGPEIIITPAVSAYIAIGVVLRLWIGIFAYFLNGVGKVMLQLYIGTSAALVHVPLAILLGIKFGVEGVLLANIITGVPGAILLPLQYSKIINSDAVGVWNK